MQLALARLEVVAALASREVIGEIAGGVSV